MPIGSRSTGPVVDGWLTWMESASEAAPAASVGGLFSGVHHRVRRKQATESFAGQPPAESLYARFIGRTSNYKSLTKELRTQSKGG